MNDIFPFKCRHCTNNLLLTVKEARESTICSICKIYKEKFGVYLDDFKAELTTMHPDSKVDRIVAYAIAMNEYADNLKMEQKLNIPYFEQLIELASNDPIRGYDYYKLKYDIYESVSEVVRLCAKTREDQYERERQIYMNDTWSPHPRKRQPDKNEITYIEIRGLIKGDPEEYLNYEKPVIEQVITQPERHALENEIEYKATAI